MRDVRPRRAVSPVVVSALVSAAVASLAWVVLGRVGSKPTAAPVEAKARTQPELEPARVPPPAAPRPQAAPPLPSGMEPARAAAAEPAPPPADVTAEAERDGHTSRLERSGPAPSTFAPLAAK